MIKNKNKKLAFTLIELLVVIVIIGILSSIGIATFNSYIKKAHETKIGTFSQEISNELKRQAIVNEVSPIGIWNFDNNLNDSSGNGNTLSAVTSDVNFNVADSIFLGTHYAHFDGGRAGATLNTPLPNEFSVSYIVKYPTNTPTRGYPIYFRVNTAQITNNGANGNLLFHPFPGFLSTSNATNDKKWHHVLFTYKNGNLKAWLDGKLTHDVSHTIPIFSTLQWLYIGNGGGGSDMYYDNLHFYPIAIDPNF